MSEYQYYEFLAIDRVLSDDDMNELRSISTRASITPISFINEYNWGDLKANPLELLARYFDAFVYYSSWGARRVAFRFPEDALDEGQLAPFLVRYQIVLSRFEKFRILDISSRDEGGWDWEAEGWMAGLAPLRDELMSGDLRPPYIAWLMAAQSDEVDDGDHEPPVPPGLGALTPAQELLAEFLRVDEGLLSVAADASDELSFSDAELAAWIAGLPARQKDRLIFDVAAGKQKRAGAALLKQFRDFRQARAGASERPAPRRVRALLEAAFVRGKEIERERQRLEEEERQRREAEAARKRAEHLAALAEREAAAWRDVERLASTRTPAAYDEALALLCDLRDLAVLQSAGASFAVRLERVRKRHVRKSSFMARLRHAGLIT